MTRIICSVCLLLPALLLSGAARARQRDQDEPIRLKTDLVTLTAAVQDSGGRAIKTLKADDFAVYEDGVRQKITHFERTDEPFTIMLLLDFSGSTRDEISLMKLAARKFLAELREGDRVGVIVFSGDVELLVDITGDRRRIESAIESESPPAGENGASFSPKTGTSFYDALFLAADDSPLKKVEGRKAIVCMSDGVDSTSKMTYRDISGLVEKSEASVYFLKLNTEAAMIAGLLKPRTDPTYISLSPGQVARYYDEHEPDSMDRHKPRYLMTEETRREIATALYKTAAREMGELSERTGGRLYTVNALTDLTAVYKQVADDLRAQYSIGYYPQNEVRDGRWRSIRVEVRQPKTTVRARSGYWAK
jgi:Ca-activated chloride channel homolog